MPDFDDVDLNRVDRYATRVFTLAVKFFGAHTAVSSSTIHDELYPDLDEQSFRRQFLRDRNLLASLGIVISEVENRDDVAKWQVDEHASYVQGGGISSDDARLLYILCHDMVFDQAFPYRDELRVALLKISRAFQGTMVAPQDQGSAYDHKILAALVSALTNHEAVEARYTDAKGTKSKRLLAPLGTFGLRENTYFVASRIERDGTLVEGSARTYRLDRFSHVTAVQPAISYQVPEDFSVRDFERLPFQIGDNLGVANINIGNNPSHEARRAISASGVVDATQTWEVPYSSTRALASWCVGEGFTPQGPAELRAAYDDVIRAAAAHDAHDPSLATLTTKNPRQQSVRMSSADAITKVRQLIALAGALNREGEVITAQQVAEVLDTDYDQARRLIMLMSMGSGESYDYLPVVIDDEYHEVFLMEGAQLNVPSIRLTRSETLALSAALAALGVSPDDPLATKLADSYGSPAFTACDLAQTIEVSGTTSDTHELRLCSQAIAEGSGLAFDYRPVTQDTTARREVVPQFIRHSDASWYLDAFDLMRQDMRVFRVDRMSNLQLIDAPEKTRPSSAKRHDRMVTIRFNDPFYLDLFFWDGLQVVRRRGTSTVVRLPFYGGTWLPRHLAACAGTVQVADEDLARAIRQEAHGMSE